MKKTFYQFNARAIFPFFTCFLFIALGVYLIIDGVTIGDVERVFVAFIPIGISIYSAVAYMYYRIDFLDDKIITLGDLSDKNTKTQHKEEIPYSEIDVINIVYSNKNSKKQFCKSLVVNSAPKLYFEFVLKNKKTKWLYINQFSKKQRIKMLEIINSKTGKTFIYDEIEIKDISIYNLKERNSHKR